LQVELSLDTELSALPVAALGVVSKYIRKESNYKPDSVSGAEAEPLRQRAVLSHLLSQNTLSAERLLRRLHNVRKWVWKAFKGPTIVINRNQNNL